MVNHGDLPPSEASLPRAYNQSLEGILPQMFQNLWSGDNNGARGTDLPRSSISLDPGTVTFSVPGSLIGFNGLQEPVPPLIPVGANEFMQNSGARGAVLPRSSISLDQAGAYELWRSAQIQNLLSEGMTSSSTGNGGNSLSNTYRLNHLHQGQSLAGGNYYGDYLTGESLNSSLGYDLGNPVNRAFVGNPLGETVSARVPAIPNLLTTMDSSAGWNNFSPSNPIVLPINNGPFIGHNNPWVEFQSREATIRNSCSESNASTEHGSVIQNPCRNLVLLCGWSKDKILRLLNTDMSLFNELQGQDIIFIAKSETGSEYLQRFLDMEDPANVKKIFDGAILSIFDLMSDHFGNYLFQKLLECCNLDQIKRIVLEVTQRHGLIDVANDQYGTRSVQKLLTMLKHLNVPLIECVMSTLAPRMDLLMKSKYGSHLIQHCLRHLNHKQNKFIYKAAIKNCLTLALDEQGCISLKGIIETIRNPHREELLWTIVLNSVFLSQDSFGNYVVQNVLDLRNPNFTMAICNQFIGSYEQLSMQKHSSHVIEKCLNSIGMEVVVMDLLLGDRLVELAQDKYGNYVIQTALKTTKKERYNLYKYLVMVISPHLHRLQNHLNGNNVFNLINKDIPKLSA